MCRPKSKGGRRCPGHSTPSSTPSAANPIPASDGPKTELPPAAVPASAPPGTSEDERKNARAARRAVRVERWAAADGEMRDATADVEGRPYGSTVTNVLVGALARQLNHADTGGNPAVYDSQVAEGRAVLTNVLTGRGDSPDVAAAKIARLENAYQTWVNTPEAHPARTDTAGGQDTVAGARGLVTVVSGNDVVDSVIGHVSHVHRGPTSATDDTHRAGAGGGDRSGERAGEPLGSGRPPAPGPIVTIIRGNGTVGEQLDHQDNRFVLRDGEWVKE